MDSQRRISGALGAVLGALVGALVSLWWPDSYPLGMTVALGAASGVILGLALGTHTSEWLGALLDSLLWARRSPAVAAPSPPRPKTRWTACPNSLAGSRWCPALGAGFSLSRPPSACRAGPGRSCS